jgi:hypothetical protein
MHCSMQRGSPVLAGEMIDETLTRIVVHAAGIDRMLSLRPLRYEELSGYIKGSTAAAFRFGRCAEVIVTLGSADRRK